MLAFFVAYGNMELLHSVPALQPNIRLPRPASLCGVKSTSSPGGATILDLKMEKQCTKCKMSKPLGEFHKHPGRRLGIASRCKACVCELTANWKRKLSPVRLLEYMIAKNIRAQQKRKENPDKDKEQKNKWKAQNPHYSREYCKRHAESARARTKAWNKANPGKRSAARNNRKRLLRFASTASDPAAIIAVYHRAKTARSVRCYLCLKLIPLSERHVDHVIPLARGGAHAGENLAIACAGCNLSKSAKPLQDIGWLPYDEVQV